MKRSMVTIIALLLLISQSAFAIPPITGEPVVDAPQLLDWPRSNGSPLPDLTEATANRLTDVNGEIATCGFVLSTAGNYHMALRDLWYDVFLPSAKAMGMKNWFYTTSPPIAVEQIQNANVTVGNLMLKCLPHIAVGPAPHINTLKSLGLVEGETIPVYRNFGNVILVKKGNPKRIQTVWDLGRPDISVITPNPVMESSTFTNYSETIYNIAVNDEKNVPRGWTADRLYNSIFNSKNGNRHKWLAGGRIHHREVPWSIAYGKADAGILFYHLALHAARTFPDLFEIVPLGGTVECPDPLPGNRVGSHSAIRVKGNFTAEEIAIRDRFVEAIRSSEFTTILEKHGLRR